MREMGLTEDQIHENAEKYEHILTDSLMDEVAEELGNPDRDPHGSPIPQVLSADSLVLSTLPPGAQAFVSLRQANHLVRSGLWDLGIQPGEALEVLRSDTAGVEVLLGGKNTFLPHRLASKTLVEMESVPLNPQ